MRNSSASSMTSREGLPTVAEPPLTSAEYETRREPPQGGRLGADSCAPLFPSANLSAQQSTAEPSAEEPTADAVATSKSSGFGQPGVREGGRPVRSPCETRCSQPLPSSRQPAAATRRSGAVPAGTAAPLPASEWPTPACTVGDFIAWALCPAGATTHCAGGGGGRGTRGTRGTRGMPEALNASVNNRRQAPGHAHRGQSTRTARSRGTAVTARAVCVRACGRGRRRRHGACVRFRSPPLKCLTSRRAGGGGGCTRGGYGSWWAGREAGWPRGEAVRQAPSGLL